MQRLKLDTVLLFVLLIPFILTHRIGLGDTPFWLFGIIFLVLFSYGAIDIATWRELVKARCKNILLWVLIIVTIGSSYYSAIIIRHQTSPQYQTHDIILQQEAAIHFTLHKVNPYATTYFSTPMAKWHYSDTEVNPALYHFVMEPFYLLFAIPFYLIMSRTNGYFDGRVPLVFLFGVLLIFAWKLVKESDKKRQFVTLLAFNPATLSYFIEGRDDIYMFAFLFVALFFFFKNRRSFGSVFLALAFAVKQSVWPLFPFYIVYLYSQERSWKKVFQKLIPFAITFGVIVLPFFLWKPKAYIDSTIFYLSGNVAHSYPIAGYGFSVLLHQLGFIKNIHAYYPFWIWQAIVCIPLLITLIRWQMNENSIPRLITAYGLFLFVFWYFSRYFHDSHVGYLTMIFISAYFWPEKKGVQSE